MDNFELIDDYLANRLQEQDRKAFENQLEGDPALKEEVDFQQQVVRGVQQARVAELKSMLSNVPISTNFWSGGKIAAAVVTAGVVATSLYFYMNTPEETIANNEPKQEIINQNEAKTIDPIVPSNTETKSQDSITTQQVFREKSKTNADEKKTTPVNKPDIKVVDPSEEFAQTEEMPSITPQRSEISPSKMEVVIGPVDKKQNFHYQFQAGKLFLYGPFDHNLYEILEIHGEGHAVFLFYKENYFLLDEKQSTITKLEAIKDGQLLKKLREYRGQ